MSDVDAVDIKAALRAQLGSQRRKVSGSAEGRRALEREANNPHDARLTRKLTRGPTVQLNIDLREPLKLRLTHASRLTGEKIFEIVERALEVELAKMEREHV